MAINPVGGTATHATLVTTLAATYSPTAGNIVVVGVGTGGASSALSVTDNLSNTLTAGPSITNGQGADISYLFYYTAPSGVTGFTAHWTGTANAAIYLEEYSGALGGVNPVGGSNASTAVPASPVTISLISSQNNSFVVGSLYFPGNPNLGTLTAGNSRQSLNDGGDTGRLADNTAASSGTSVSLTNTINANQGWAVTAVELLPNAAPPANSSHNFLMLMGCGT